MSVNESPLKSRWATWLALSAVLITAALVGAATLRPRALWLAPLEQDRPTGQYTVTVRKPTGPPVVATDAKDAHGRPITVNCNTCHLSRPANLDTRLGTSLATFHQYTKGKHGELACAACHNPADGYQSLRLANGQAVPYTEVMQLCAQCHGPQYRDYQHGAHGGMTGFWDLKRGPRVRNNCVHCHDPHSPRYPVVQPARGPGDVLPTGKKGASHE